MSPTKRSSLPSRRSWGRRCGGSPSSTSATPRSSRRSESGGIERRPGSRCNPSGGRTAGRRGCTPTTRPRPWSPCALATSPTFACWRHADGSARGAQVVSVDADEKAIDWARRREVPRPVRFIAGRAEDVLPTLPEPSAVVVNPPRAGLHWNVTLRLTGQPVNRLIYVSCDPATLARDLHRLSATYRVTAVRAFDLFPQTAQVETVVAMEAA